MLPCFFNELFSCASKYVKIHVYVARSAGGRSENQEGAQKNRRSLNEKKMLLVQPDFLRCRGSKCPPGFHDSAGPGSSASKKRFQFHEVVNQKCLVTNILVKAKVA